MLELIPSFSPDQTEHLNRSGGYALSRDRVPKPSTAFGISKCHITVKDVVHGPGPSVMTQRGSLPWVYSNDRTESISYAPAWGYIYCGHLLETGNSDSWQD